MSNFAWVTLTTNDTYSLGALVLAHSLRRAGTQHELAVLVTPGVSEAMRDKLKEVYNVVKEVNIMDSQDSANLALLARPELGITFTKLHCWRLVQFEKCVFLDSDTLILQNCDELFEREELSAAPDVSWPDCFNSGVFVFKPSQETFDKIVEFGMKNGSFDGGDQGLLNQYFSDWATSDIKKRLPFLYNVTAYASYCYLPAFKQFRDKIKILHFAGKMKPWLIPYNSQSKTASIPSDYTHASDLIQLWWNIFFDHVHKNLNDNMRYSLTIIEPWKSNYDHMSWQQQQEQQQQHQNATNLQYNLQYEYYQQQFTNEKIEFHDPWEDYYRKQETNAEIQNKNDEAAENEENIWKLNEGKQDVTEDSYQEVVYEENYVNTEPEIHLDFNKEIEAQEESTFVASSCDCSLNATVTSDDTRNDNITERDGKISDKELELDNKEISDKNNAISRSSNMEISASTEQKVSEQNEEKVEEAGLAGALSHLRLGEPLSPEHDAYEQLMRRQCWESGQIDYSGRDSFDNIWKKITMTLETKPDNDGKTGSS